MIIDIIVIVVLLASALISFLRGLMREILTILGVVGGLAGAYFGAPLLSPPMRSWMGVEAGVEPERLFGIIPYNLVADSLSYGLIFIVIVIILSIISHTLAKTVKAMGLGAIDRTFGVIFGLLRGVLLLGLLYLPLYLLLDVKAKEAWFSDSRTHIYLEKTAQALASALPDKALNKVAKDAEKMEPLFKGALSTREKLQSIDLLKKDKDLKKDKESTNTTNTPSSPDHAKKGQEGYDKTFRENMNQLIEQEIKNEY